MPELETLGPTQKESEKAKRNKFRSAWISFVGRIVAQVVGAAASVTLGLMLLQKYQERPGPQVAEAADHPAVVRVSDHRTDGAFTLAVLPLNSFSQTSSEDYVADGMTESLIADLTQIDGLRVISRTSMMRYRNSQKSLPEIAAELDVDLMIEGSIVRAGDRVRVIAQLIDAKTDEHVWAGSYEQAFSDVLTLQAEVVSAIVRDVKGALRRARPTS